MAERQRERVDLAGKPLEWWRAQVLVTAVEAAAECGVTIRQVRGWERAGDLQRAPFTRWTGARRAVLYDWGQVLEVKTRKTA